MNKPMRQGRAASREKRWCLGPILDAGIARNIDHMGQAVDQETDDARGIKLVIRERPVLGIGPQHKNICVSRPLQFSPA
jgi:hypothetical protein